MAELKAPFDLSQPAISKHLKILERAGLTAHGRKGQRHPRALVAQPPLDVTAWLVNFHRFWE